MQDGRRRAVGRLLTVMERFRRVRHTMPVHLVEALLRVAHHEGKSVIQYAREAGVSQSVMSRHLLELGNQYVKGEPGLGLVEKRTSSHSLREFEVTLTKKGRDTVEEIVDLLQTQRLRSRSTSNE
jgi:DNA-binding MarR family transcriptional regulator